MYMCVCVCGILWRVEKHLPEYIINRISLCVRVWLLWPPEAIGSLTYERTSCAHKSCPSTDEGPSSASASRTRTQPLFFWFFLFFDQKFSAYTSRTLSKYTVFFCVCERRPLTMSFFESSLVIVWCVRACKSFAQLSMRTRAGVLFAARRPWTFFFSFLDLSCFVGLNI